MTVTKPTAIGQKAFFWLSMLMGWMLVAAGSANDIDHPKWVSITNNSNRQIPGRYIIEFNDDYMGSTEQFMDEIEREHQSFRWTMAHDYHSNQHPSSDSIFRGISIHLEEQSDIYAADTAKMSEHQVMRHVMEKHLVKHVYPVFEVPRPKLHRHNILRAQALDISPEVSGLPFSHAMTQVNRVHSELGLDGEGVLVGIIDTGVDYNHPSLGGGFGPGYKVAKGYDLVGDNLDAKNPNSIHPGKTPLDTCAGHGTHVAGIIGAEDKKYNFTGVAPKATLGMWRIFGCHGSTSTDLVIKGMIMAYEAGCNVINLSLGGPNSWPEDPSSVVADRIARRNVTMVVAAGNEGASGVYMISSPSTGFETISVASIDNEYSLHPNMQVQNGTHYPYALGSTTKSFPNGTLVAYSNTSNNTNDACEGTEPQNELNGTIALVQRGTCQFDEKANNVAKFGAIGMLVYDVQGKDTFVPSIQNVTIPVAAVSHMDGLSLLDDLQKQHQLNVTFNLELSKVPVSTGGRVSRFSSLGPTSEMDVKPDIAGVGGYVFSTLPLSQGGYGTLSGTSMASPYVAGVSALYKQAHGLDTDSVVLRQQLQSYAKMTPVETGEQNNPIRQGAGLVQAYDAIQGRLFLNPAKVSFNDTVRRTPQTITVTNTYDEPVRYVLKNVPGVSVMPYNVSKQGYAPLQPAPDNAEITAALTFNKDTISLEPGESCEIELSVDTLNGDLNSTFPYPIFGGSVQLVDASSGHVHAHVPYAGVEGNVTQLPIFGYRFPFLADASQLKPGGLSLGNNPLDKFVLDREAPPASANASVYVLSRFITGTAHMIAEVVDEDGHVLGTAYYANYIERNTIGEDGFVNINRWNGSYMPTGFEAENKFVPIMQGTYHLRWRALKMLADPNLPDSWEERTSPQIIVT